MAASGAVKGVRLADGGVLVFDANTLLSVGDHCMRSTNYVNLIVVDKQRHLQYLDLESAAGSQPFDPVTALPQRIGNAERGEYMPASAAGHDQYCLARAGAHVFLRGWAFSNWILISMATMKQLSSRLLPP